MPQCHKARSFLGCPEGLSPFAAAARHAGLAARVRLRGWAGAPAPRPTRRSPCSRCWYVRVAHGRPLIDAMRTPRWPGTRQVSRPRRWGCRIWLLRRRLGFGGSDPLGEGVHASGQHASAHDNGLLLAGCSQAHRWPTSPAGISHACLGCRATCCVLFNWRFGILRPPQGLAPATSPGIPGRRTRRGASSPDREIIEALSRSGSSKTGPDGWLRPAGRSALPMLVLARPVRVQVCRPEGSSTARDEMAGPWITCPSGANREP